ncbi:MAG: NAD-glutamate dehydrogenase, partial [Proteobacteria bacterium]|nr:NAD-glutamate dehydrogenase [Pseudomonadota bacterium]
MSPREDSRKSERIAEVAALARRRLAADQRDAAEAFLHRVYANVAAEDLLERRVEDLYGAGVALWQFGRTRSAGQAKIRVYTPRLAEHGWASLHTVIEIVNDDMPFLVDSVTTELNRRDLAVHLVIHPVVKIARDHTGTAKGLAPDGQPESFMHIEIDAQSDAETLAGIQSGIAAVLADVRAAVADWRAMVDRLQAVIAALDQQPPPVPAAEVAKERNFLKWIAANNFSFLGFREYEFAGEGGEARANVVPRQGLGLARDDGFVIFDGLRNLAALPPDVQVFVREPRLLKIAKANRRSTVHRPALLDTIGIKKFGAKGEVIG